MELINCYGRNQIVSVFCDRSRPESHLTGFIDAASDCEIVLKHISPEGRYDGFVLIHRDDVYRIDADGEYEQKIQKLYNLKNQSHPDLQYSEYLYDDLLSFCKEQNFIVSVELEECELSGFLVNFDSEFVQLQLVNDYGKRNGETVLSTNEIISFSVDSEKEQDIKLLFTTAKNYLAD